MERHRFAPPLHPAILLIDADEARGQRVACALTLADFAVYVTTTPYQALERTLREAIRPVVVVLGQGDWQSRTTDMVMRRLYSRFYEQATQPIPTLYLPSTSNPSYPSLPSLGGSRPSYPPTTAAPTARPSAPSRPTSRPGSYPSYPSYPSHPTNPANPSYPSTPSSYPSQPSRPTLPDDLNQIIGFGRLPAIQSEGARLLEQIWRVAPETAKDMRPSANALVNVELPAYGLTPRISQKLVSSNEHARQVIEAAYTIIGAAAWPTAMTDVGLGALSHPDGWPPENDERAIPAVLFSQLNAAVERSSPTNPAEQLRRWSDIGTETSLARRSSSWVTQQVIKHLPHERALSLALNGFTNELNKMRGEELHFWKPRGDGSYWLVHYSNLYTYGRARRAEPSCVVWLASIEATLQLAQVESVYEVSEVECSCQTLTGHCVFLIAPRLARPSEHRGE